MGDLIKWAAEFEEWQNESGVWGSMSTSLLMPYYIQNTASHDVLWLNIWPSSTEQYIGNEDWVTRGGDLMKKLPVTNSQVVDTWQWAISTPEGEGAIGMVSYSDCKLKEGVSGMQAFSALKDYALAAREKGDNLGRKMIFPTAGGTKGDYDYVYAKYSNTISEFGANADLYWSEINGLDEDLALNDVINTCSNYRTYTTVDIKAAKK